MLSIGKSGKFDAETADCIAKPKESIDFNSSTGTFGAFVRRSIKIS